LRRGRTKFQIMLGSGLTIVAVKSRRPAIAGVLVP
jgi:hypothetical protein